MKFFAGKNKENRKCSDTRPWIFKRGNEGLSENRRFNLKFKSVPNDIFNPAVLLETLKIHVFYKQTDNLVQ